MGRKFEYSVVDISPMLLQQRLGEFGGQGWELVTAVLDETHPRGATWRLILKREIPDA